MQKKINFIFWGTPDVASNTLEILKQSGFLPSFIVTSPDKKQGRKMLLTPPPVKTWAIENNIPFIQIEKLTKEKIDVVFEAPSERDGARQAISQQADMRGAKNNIDFFLVVAYGKIIPEEILNMPRLGSINVHYSLLPKYRGASPVESSILNGDTETGITIQKMVYKMDAGNILAVEKINIEPDETAPELRKRLIKMGAELLIKTLPNFIENKITPISQDESLAINCHKIKKEDGLIDLNDDALKNYNKFRAYAFWPRTYFFKDGKRVIITDATFKDNKFIIKKIILEGGKEQDYKGI